MSFTKAKEGEYLNVFTNIGDRSFDFQCKSIEETENGFILKECKNHDDVLINYATSAHNS